MELLNFQGANPRKCTKITQNNVFRGTSNGPNDLGA